MRVHTLLRADLRVLSFSTLYIYGQGFHFCSNDLRLSQSQTLLITDMSHPPMLSSSPSHCRIFADEILSMLMFHCLFSTGSELHVLCFVIPVPCSQFCFIVCSMFCVPFCVLGSVLCAVFCVLCTTFHSKFCVLNS